MKVAVLMLCHEAPALIARRLGMAFFRDPHLKVYLHYDRKRSDADFASLKRLLGDGLQWAALDDRIACEWGEFSLVEAQRRLVALAVDDATFEADYLLLASGSCVPIRPLASLREYLSRRHGIDFIQAHDIATGPWVKGGLEAERYAYYFPVNFLTHRRLFDRLTDLQRRIGVRRPVPEGLRVHFGSQWFCLTRSTSIAVLRQLERPELRSFFRHTWIPDEFAFQTLVAAVQRPALISGFGLTYYEFDGEGRPLVLDNGHEAHLARQPFFMARKLAPEAGGLQQWLDARCAAPERDFSYFDDVGRPTVDYRRFLAAVQSRSATRSAIGTIVDPVRGPLEANRHHYYVVVGSSQRFVGELLRRAREASGLPIYDFPFDERAVLAAAGHLRYRGFQASDRARRNYDPAAFLLELVRTGTDSPIAFGFDLAQDGRLRDLLRADGNAIVIDADPPALSANQRAAAGLQEAQAVGDADLLQRIRHAALIGQPLPRDPARLAGAEADHRCVILPLHAVDQVNETPVVRALHGAWQSLAIDAHFPAAGRATAMVLE